MKNIIYSIERFPLKKIVFLIILFLFCFKCSKEDIEIVFSDFAIVGTTGIDSIALDWEDVTVSNQQNITYDVYVNNVLKEGGLKISEYTVIDLDSEVEYLIKIVAKVETGHKKEVEKVFITKAKPIPSQFIITSKDISSKGFTIEWTASTITGDQEVKYDVLLDGSLLAKDLGALTYEFSGLDAKTTYTVKVVAKSVEFETESVQTITVTTNDTPIPSQFTITSENISSKGFTIEWTALSITSGQVRYDVFLDDSLVAKDLGELTYEFSGLDAKTTYTVKVVAKSVEFNTQSVQSHTVTTIDNPIPNDFTLSVDSITAQGAFVSWSSLTINGDGGVLADIYLNGNELISGVTASGYILSNLMPKTEYVVKVIARSSEYGTTLEKNISFTSAALAITFKVTSAEIYPRRTGTFASPPSAIIRFSNRSFLNNIELNGVTYSNWFHAGDDGITFSISDTEFEALRDAGTKEGTANFTENGTSASLTFTYNVN